MNICDKIGNEVYVVILNLVFVDAAFHNYSDALAHIEKLRNSGELENPDEIGIQCVSIY